MEAYLIKFNGKNLIWTPTNEEIAACATLAKAVGCTALEMAAYRVLYPIGTINTGKIPHPEPLKRYTNTRDCWEITVAVEAPTVILR